MLAAIGLAGCAAPATTPSHTAPTWKRVWIDTFDGAAGLPPPARWSADTGGDGWGNRELEYYTPGSQNASLDGRGHLVLTADKSNQDLACWYGRCEFTSARLTTAPSSTVRYGRIEARMKVPVGAGLWSAFWMLGAPTAPNNWPNDGEIDIAENIGSEPATVHGSLHGPGYAGLDSLTATFTTPSGEPLSSRFHTYAIIWSRSSIEYLVDGEVYAIQTPDTTRGNRWVFDRPFSLILNLAVGGTWPGSPATSTVFPAQLVVDYVAVYRRS
nr:glycoside hydrolase family 16 protein [Galbitalea soli]